MSGSIKDLNKKNNCRNYVSIRISLILKEIDTVILNKKETVNI